jgi:general secretion pathway protein C
MLARITAFVVWGLVAASVVAWGLKLLVRPPPAPGHALSVGDATVLRGDLGRLLGAAPVAAAADAPTAPELSSRFKLLGVMAPKPPEVAGVPGPGYALIAVDGKPARAYAVGAPLDGGLVLQSVSLRSASIGPAEGATAVKLELPPLAAPATGTLPAPGAAGAATAPPPAPPAAAPRQPITTAPPPAAPPGTRPAAPPGTRPPGAQSR